MIFEEEHHFYQIDCNKAVWATDEVNDLYKHNVACLLTDADWIIETENDGVLIVETVRFSLARIHLTPTVKRK